MFKYKVGTYIRLSRDESYSDSDSIDKNLEVVEKYIDNGYSGTNFNRPAFKQMLKDIDEGLINTIVVKDLSRFGRNYILVGHYLENYFPCKKVRFISINDDYDSLVNKNIMNRLDVPLKNMLHDHVAYETSEKIKKSLRLEKEKGKFIGSSVIYGYKKDPDDIHKLVIDQEAADVVRNIFQMFLSCMTKTDIANELNNRNVMTPALYKKINGLGYTKANKDNKWNYEMVDRILKDENYTGKLVQGKRRNESYKTHKEVKVSEKDWIKFKNHHEAVIDAESFKKVQDMLKIQRRASNKNDILSGYLKCADCAGVMTLIKGKNNEYYYCRNNLSKKICSKHTIRKDYIINEVIRIINMKKLTNDEIKELNREIVTKLIDVIYIYEYSKLEVVFKDKRNIIKN